MNKLQKHYVTKFLLSIIFIVCLLFNNHAVEAANSYEGVALNAPTYVYSSASRDSDTLKRYKQGSILKYTSYNSGWYQAVVYVNGNRKIGYINKSDVETVEPNPMQIKGIALNSQTNVFSSVSTSSTILKSYPAGTILSYRTFSANWYKATVYVKGKRQTGYIHKSHVENAINSQDSFKGVALKSPTSVYTRAATSSKALKSYAIGSILSYRTFSTNWYEATVYVNGTRRTGYIHKSHVDDAVKSPQSATGIGLKGPTVIYSRASSQSPALKSYSQGTILRYQTFTSGWYQAKVYINGKATTGFIDVNDIEGLYETSKSLDGAAVKDPTHVYSKASKSSKSLRSYKKGSLLKFRTLSKNWYEATVYINGKRTTGYIHIEDVNTDKLIITTTSYPTTFTSAVSTQMTKSPQVSGKTGGWVDASKEQVEYYINSSNFSKNTNSYYQFLVLSVSAGLNPTEVNQKILYNHGTLTGQASAFIQAGKKFSINEAYLISHALLETGNGASDLAKGVPVDGNGEVVPKEQAVHTVYNMYGIGATDKCPLSCGAKRALKEEWFSPEEAIIGGAEFINTYIDRGQDTLYKMRWNPVSPGHPQYATDIGWAVKQTNNISRIYNLLDNYVLIYDIPKYANQPSSSGDPDAYLDPSPPTGTVTRYPGGVYGLINTDKLNFREKPDTSSTSSGKLPKGEKVEVLGEISGQEINGNKVWYQVKTNGKTGYVHSPYVNLINLLEAKVTLNVRPEPNTSKPGIGTVSKGAFIKAVLDKDNKIVRNKEWYQVTYNGKNAWVSGGKSGTENIRIK